MTTYTLDLPDAPYLTPNSRAHWRKRSEYGRTWRRSALLVARASKVPPMVHARVALEMHPRERRRRDADNLVSGVLKHCIDGLVDAGVVPDDSPEYVTAVMPVIVPPDGARPGAHRWRLILTEADADG